MVDVVISVKGKGNVSLTGSSGSSVSLGGDSAMKLSDQVQLDGSQWVTMPAGYPSVDLQGQSSVFTFRFPKFDQTALYDPLMTGISPVTYPDDRDHHHHHHTSGGMRMFGG